MHTKTRAILWGIISSLLLFCLVPNKLWAQEDEHWADDDYYEDSEGDPWEYSVHTRTVAGDNMFNINIGLFFGLSFIDGTGQNLNTNLGIGGAGALSYDKMITNNFLIGAELSGSFSSTLGANILYTVPFGLRLGYQFEFSRFQLPIILFAGCAIQSEIEDNYFGLALKLQPGFFWRFNDSWSFGSFVAWWLMPEFANSPQETVWASFLFTSLCARYHF